MGSVIGTITSEGGSREERWGGRLKSSPASASASASPAAAAGVERIEEREEDDENKAAVHFSSTRVSFFRSYAWTASAQEIIELDLVFASHDLTRKQKMVPGGGERDRERRGNRTERRKNRP